MERTILAVDDSETMRSMVEQTLSLSGYKVVLAEDGQEGLDMFRSGNFSVVVTDINMPRMDGLRLISEIRKINTSVPILTLTTEQEDGMKKRGADAGANGWIVKPFRPAQFLDVVRQAMEA